MPGGAGRVEGGGVAAKVGLGKIRYLGGALATKKTGTKEKETQAAGEGGGKFPI